MNTDKLWSANNAKHAKNTRLFNSVFMFAFFAFFADKNQVLYACLPAFICELVLMPAKGDW